MKRSAIAVLAAASLLAACGGQSGDAAACDTAVTPFAEHNEAVQAWVDAPDDDKPDVDRDGLSVMPAALEQAAEQAESEEIRRWIEAAQAEPVDSQEFFLAMGFLERACEDV